MLPKFATKLMMGMQETSPKRTSLHMERERFDFAGWLWWIVCRGWVSSQVCSEISRTVAFLNSTIQAYVIP